MTDLEEPGSGAPGDDAAPPAGVTPGGVTPGTSSSAGARAAGTSSTGAAPAAEPEVGAGEADSPASRREVRAAGKKPHPGLSALRETVIVLGSALLISLVIKTFLVQAFFIPSESMEPTMEVGDRVLVSRLVPGPLDLHRGDIVVFVDPGGWLKDSGTPANPVTEALTKAGEFVGLLPSNTGSHLIKRVIGMPGDHVVCCNPEGLITVNDVPITEPYLMPGANPSDTAFDVVVPEGHLWVLGDNRDNSGDSRAHMGGPGGGMVPIDNVVGVAQVRMWPLDRLGVLRNPGATFADVPASAP